jgi:hypothetical protein
MTFTLNSYFILSHHLRQYRNMVVYWTASEKGCDMRKMWWRGPQQQTKAPRQNSQHSFAT